MSLSKLGPKPNDIAGKKYDRLTAVQFSHLNRNKRPYWIFKCDCGKVVTRLKINVTRRNGSLKSCGCFTKEFAKQQVQNIYHPLPLGTTATHAIMQQYKKNAEVRHLPFGLSNKEFEEFILSPCFYCGAMHSNRFRTKGRLKEMYYNGIDRYDNHIGYIKENCRTCCKDCNWAKGSKNGPEFEAYLDRIIAFRIRKIEQ